MTEPRSESLWNACLDSLRELVGARADIQLAESSSPGGGPFMALASAFPDRIHRVGPAPDDSFRAAAQLAEEGRRPVFLSARASRVAQGYGAIRQAISHARANVKIVAQFPWPSPPSEDGVPPAVEDVGLMRGLPAMSVVVPADAPTTRTAVAAIAAVDGPVYARIAEGDHPIVSDGAFALGRANQLRDGSDLTVVAIGPLVGAALALAEEFQQVGVGVRVLDCASVKPIDAPALLRAARDTGAILVAEEHTVETGFGEFVAAIVSENFAIPIRRVGIPDLFEVPAGSHGTLGPAGDRMRDEAWELLRLRGKVQ